MNVLQCLDAQILKTQSPFQHEQLVPTNSTRLSTRCPEGPDAAPTRQRSSYKHPPQTMGCTRNLAIKETGGENGTAAYALRPDMWEPSPFGPWPWSVLPRYPAQGLCLLILPEGCEFLGSCSHLKPPLQASPKLLSWLTGHILGCYPWAGWFTSGCWQSLRGCLPAKQSNKMFNSSPSAIV